MITLLYHSVGHIDSGRDPYRLNVPPENFDKHLKVISKFKYRDKIEITFDDGYGNNFEHAFSLLKKYNLNATVFLITDFIDGKISSEDFAGEKFKVRPLTWEEVRIMDSSGIKFGSHSKTHSFLTKISKDDLKIELEDSKKRIEEMLGHRIYRFAYPFGSIGSFNNMIKEAVMNAKYNYAYTNIMGCNPINHNNTLSLKRIRIYGEDSPFKLRMKIEGGYAWVDRVRMR